ncbi:MAG: protein kinase domain-containing protein [Acidithiobacillales bacterium]
MRFGTFEIVSRLGSGGMGEVWKAKDLRLGRTVAIKVLPETFFEDEERKARFGREARTLASLNHPGIATLYSFEEISGRHLLVQELLEGRTLREELLEGALPAKRAVEIGVQAARALAAAHEKGVVHRDLKPENVFLTKDGRAKILDFGLAKPERRDAGEGGTKAETASVLTEAGVVMGTVSYMAPEQLRGETADRRTDLFSFGVVLQEMLSGQSPFRRTTAAETMSAILKDEPPPLPEGTPQGLALVVSRCLAKNPGDRFQTASDLAFSLEALSGGTLRIVEPSVPHARPRAVVVSLVAVAMAAGLAGMYALGKRAGVAPSPTYKRLTFRRGFVSRALFAPDGQTILYTASWEGQPREVFSTRVDSKESRPLGIPGVSEILSVSASAEALVLHRSGEGRSALAQVSLAGGAPRDLLEGVSSASWGPGGSSFAVLVRARGARRIEFPSGQVLLSTPDYIDDVCVSPEGRYVAFLSRPNTSTGYSVDVVDRDGKRRSLSKGWNYVQSGGLAWSPKGDEVWFAGDRDGGTRWLNAASLSGAERVLTRLPDDGAVHDVFRDGRLLLTREVRRHSVVVLPPGESRERDLSWLDFSSVASLTPDGRKVLIVEFGEGGGAGYTSYLRKTDGSPATRLTEGGSVLSPDGRWAVAVVRGGPPKLMLVPAGAGETRPLPLGGITSTNWMEWTPDGRHVLFNGRERGAGYRVYRKDVNSPALPEALTPEGYAIPWGSQPVSPDGTRFFAVAPEGRVVFVPSGGGQAVPVPGLVPGEEPFQWIEGGKGLLARSPDAVPARIWRIDVATGQRTFLRELTPPDLTGVTSITDVRFTPDLRSYAFDYWSRLSDLYLVEGLR